MLSTVALAHVALLSAAWTPIGIWAYQGPLYYPQQDAKVPCSPKYTCFAHEILRVAVIGAGPAGLQAAAALIDHGKEVRLFERKLTPGGNWNYNHLTPVPAPFPSNPLDIGAYTPDIPLELPASRIYHDGDEGIANHWRLREHWDPSPVWDDLKVNSPPSLTGMPGIPYPPDTPWAIPNGLVLRNVRQYASSVGLNSNDEENANVTSYSTRVEKIQKLPGVKEWVLTLRKLEVLPYPGGNIRAEWWTESFDAVVVSAGPFDAPWVPDIPGLSDWAREHPREIYHSRNYRSPKDHRGKNVLIVGDGVSASEIARNLVSYVGNFSISLTPHIDDIFKRRSFLNLPANITQLPRIKSFSPLGSSKDSGIRNMTMILENGTIIGGFDEIIFCTGYRQSYPFLAGFHNTSIIGDDEPETEIAPILTDGLRLRSIHWTGHYIPDPTLAFTSYLRPYTLGRYQSLGIAKVWSGKARLPSTAKMWELYPGTRRDLWELGPHGTIAQEGTERMWVTWLNAASLEFGGRLVAPSPVQDREEFAYFADKLWEKDYIDHDKFIEFENTPQSEWPRRNTDPL